MFDMDIGSVARQLLVVIGAPRGQVNVVPRPLGADTWELEVWVRTAGGKLDIPNTFEGVPVHVVKAPQARTERVTLA